MSKKNFAARRGFTLVELMVAIGIIALLVGILLPAARSVRVGAKKAATTATFSAISTSIEAFKSDQKIGGSFPPSTSDVPSTSPFGEIQDPFATSSPQTMVACGANLLAFALQGADSLGTPGFIDLPDTTGVRDGQWWNDVNANYKVGTNSVGVPDHARYGPYADSTLQQKASSLAHLIDKGILVTKLQKSSEAAKSQNLPFYLDGFDRPILYFRARPSATFMVTQPGIEIGIFDQRDNCVLTGTNVGGTGSVSALDFGGGLLTALPSGATGHGITETLFPNPSPLTADLAATAFDNTFERFIWNRNITQKNMPNRADSYLLISAGEDGIYGNADDITNWNRDE